MKLTVLFLVIILATCSGQKNQAGTGSDGAENQDSDNYLTLIVSDSYSGVETAETIIIKDAKSLKTFYSQINRTRKPGLPVPNIDFSKEMIIVRCSGTTRDGAMPELYVKHETEEKLTLGINKPIGAVGSTAITTPFSLYKTPLIKAEVVVKE